MFSFRRPGITDSKSQAAIAKARNENGVHIYFDVPHVMKSAMYTTTVANLGNTKSKFLNYTALCRATGDAPEFRTVHLAEDQQTRIEIGFSKGYVVSIKDGNAVEWSNRRLPDAPTTWRRNMYTVVTLNFKYPSGPFKIEVNGVPHGEANKFKKIKDFSKFGYWFAQHHGFWSHIEVLEVHFLYTGITQGLPPRNAGEKYVSLQKASVCFMGQGSTAVIVGQYAQHNNKYSGIVIGVCTEKQHPMPKEFASHKDSNEMVTFRVSVGIFNVAIRSNKEQQLLDLNIGPDDNAWLVVDNINILNLEIHTGTRVEKRDGTPFTPA